MIAVALGVGLRGLALTARGRDPYDLARLMQEVDSDERRNLRERDAESNPERMLCMRCGEEFEAKFPECPHCFGRL
jgi:hypothetical protein